MWGRQTMCSFRSAGLRKFTPVGPFSFDSAIFPSRSLLFVVSPTPSHSQAPFLVSKATPPRVPRRSYSCDPAQSAKQETCPKDRLCSPHHGRWYRGHNRRTLLQGYLRTLPISLFFFTRAHNIFYIQFIGSIELF